MKIFKDRFKRVKYFKYRTGSVLFRSFSIYEISFSKKEFHYQKEKNGNILEENKISLTDEDIIFIKEKLDLSEYYLFEEKYINFKIKDGNQWSLLVEYFLGKKETSGSNLVPDKFSYIFEIIEFLKQKIN